MKTYNTLTLILLFCLTTTSFISINAQARACSSVWIISSQLSNATDKNKLDEATLKLQETLKKQYLIKRINLIHTKEEWNEALPDILKDKNNQRPPLLIFLGHANSTPTDVHFHLSGEDISIRSIGNQIRSSDGQAGIIWSAEAGRSIIQLLKAKNHVILAAAELEDKDNEPVLNDLLANMMIAPDLDSNHNKQVDLAEIQSKAKQQIKQWFTNRNLLQLETILLDGNGDGKGTMAPDQSDLTGSKQLYLQLR